MATEEKFKDAIGWLETEEKEEQKSKAMRGHLSELLEAAREATQMLGTFEDQRASLQADINRLEDDYERGKADVDRRVNEEYEGAKLTAQNEIDELESRVKHYHGVKERAIRDADEAVRQRDESEEELRAMKREIRENENRLTEIKREFEAVQRQIEELGASFRRR